MEVLEAHRALERLGVEERPDAQGLADVALHHRVGVGAPLQPAGVLQAPDVGDADGGIGRQAVGADRAEQLVAANAERVEPAVALGAC